jgi:hypothetical protein
MPDDPKVWIILIIAGAVVIALLGTLAIRSGRRLKITRDGVEIDRSAADKEEGGKSNISVASGARITGSKTGDIAGVKGAGEVNGSIDVAKGARIDNAEVGDIAGVKSDGEEDKQ